jgi:type IX secretion system PorP/SprF family membrane protein
MKKIIIIFIFSLVSGLGFAQQFPLQSQYQFNYATINPAVVGENNFYRARASFRDQWGGLTDNPISTQILTVTKGFGNNGLGITVFSDKTGGLFNKTGASISYSHKVRFERSDLSFGVSGGADKINLSYTDDPAVLSNDDIIPEITFGVYYTYNDIKLGVSVPGLLNANMQISESNENTIDRHFYTMLSYQKKINKTWSVYPSILVKTTANHNQIDANVNFKVKNTLWFGSSYRQDFGPTLYIGIDFGKLLSVYSFDISTNKVADYSNGSHEFTLGYDFLPNDFLNDNLVKEEETLTVSLNDRDRDKDGVEDKFDMCPDVPGDILTNGCPDSDKDGIPDKYDLCPQLYGSIGIQGCPELTSEEIGIIIKAINNLHFDKNMSEIKYESYSSLTDIAVLMHLNPHLLLLIEGHASPDGPTFYNLSLSARRAKSVQKFLISRGVNKSKLVIDFHGEEVPLNVNKTKTERESNRRVEFSIKYHLLDINDVADVKNEYDSLLNYFDSNQGETNKEEEEVDVEEEMPMDAAPEMEEGEEMEAPLEAPVEEEVVDEDEDETTEMYETEDEEVVDE